VKDNVDLLKGVSARRQFERLVAEITDDLVRTGYLMTWDLCETEDLVQEALLRVARRWNRVRSMDHPEAYTRRILINLVIDGREVRSRRSRELDWDEEVVDAFVDDAAARTLREIESASEFQLALAELPRRMRSVIVLRYWQDLPEAEVAELLGCSIGTVKSTASRGIARLREVLGRTRLAAPDPITSAANSERRPS
jgi:RNA polymerase sigma-70 factor (sigma-E family)